MTAINLFNQTRAHEKLYVSADGFSRATTIISLTSYVIRRRSYAFRLHHP